MFKENPSRGIGDMERTQNSRLKHMTLTCDLDLGMVDLWVLHIDSLRQTFDQSLMKIFQRVQEIRSRQESVTEGQTDGQMKAISIIPHLLHGGGLKTRKNISKNKKKYFKILTVELSHNMLT